jgi:hypothetical protein
VKRSRCYGGRGCRRCCLLINEGPARAESALIGPHSGTICRAANRLWWPSSDTDPANCFFPPPAADGFSLLTLLLRFGAVSEPIYGRFHSIMTDGHAIDWRSCRCGVWTSCCRRCSHYPPSKDSLKN